MTTAPPHGPDTVHRHTTGLDGIRDHAVLDLVVPVLDEERVLERSVRRVVDHLRDHFPYPFRVTIADSASTDATPRIAARLADELPEVAVVRQDVPGRGRALQAAWRRSDADVLAYCDVDLSTDLNALLPLVAPLLSGHSELAIGSRLTPSARVVRGPKREVLSRGYNLLLRGTLRTRFSDAQCGFKAIRRDAALRLLPLVEDTGWFFDTELLVLAEEAGMRIHEVPVDWVDDPDSRVDIVRTCVADVRGIARMARTLVDGSLPLGRGGPEPDRGRVPTGRTGLGAQLLRFGSIGVACTALHLLLFLLLRTVTGPVSANGAALVVTTVLNTAANRRLTFGLSGRAGRLRHQLRGFAVFGAGLVLTTAALGLVPPGVGRPIEVATVLAGNAAATLLRFLLFRTWVFRARPGGPLRDRPGDVPARAAAEIALTGLLLAGTALLYVWDLGANGWANTYYAAAVQAGSQDVTAWFFGSLDASNAITADKPPLASAVMVLSARVFGLSPWSMLLPQAIMGVVAVALLSATVRRVAGPWAGLVAGLLLALTPVAALMFRFNNPDALLVLLLVAAAWATTRAIEGARTRWLLLAGALVGLAFLTKMMAAFVVVPGLVAAYLWAAPVAPLRRAGQLLAGGAAMVLATGWYLVAAAAWPAGRPWIGGSSTDSVLDLAFGYNGLGRLAGGDGTGGDAAATGPMAEVFTALFGPPAGPGRLFSPSVADQGSWLLPAASVLLVVGLVLTRRATRTDRVRAALLLWGGWAVVSAVLFSLMEGTFHPYYTVVLAPAVSALVAVGGRELLRARHRRGPAILAVVVLGTAGWSVLLLTGEPQFLPWMRWLLAAGAAVVAASAVVAAVRGRPLGAVAVTAAVAVSVAGPAAWSVATAAAPQADALAVSAGPPPPGTATGRAASGDGGGELVTLLRGAGTRWSAATVTSFAAAPMQLESGTPVMTVGGFMGTDPFPTLDRFQRHVADGDIRYFVLSPDVERFAETLDAASGGAGIPGAARDVGEAGDPLVAWVSATFPSRVVDGQRVFDLASGRTS